MFDVLFKAEFEIGKGLFENLENSKSDLPNFWKFENWKSFQMNVLSETYEPLLLKPDLCQTTFEIDCMGTHASFQGDPNSSAIPCRCNELFGQMAKHFTL